MTAYVVAEIDVTDHATYDTYRPRVPPTLEKYGGKFAARGGRIELLEGGPEPKRVVIIEFADAAAARRWYESPEYQEALKIRHASSTGRVFIIEG